MYVQNPLTRDRVRGRVGHPHPHQRHGGTRHYAGRAGRPLVRVIIRIEEGTPLVRVSIEVRVKVCVGIRQNSDKGQIRFG